MYEANTDKILIENKLEMNITCWCCLIPVGPFRPMISDLQTSVLGPSSERGYPIILSFLFPVASCSLIAPPYMIGLITLAGRHACTAHDPLVTATSFGPSAVLLEPCARVFHFGDHLHLLLLAV